MRIPVLAATAAFALTACSSIGDKKLAVCDGKHLRPANPYGTVLAPAVEGATPLPWARTDEAKPMSFINPPAASGSCRA